jgi:DNA modification methylase
MVRCEIKTEDCLKSIQRDLGDGSVALTFLDPPFNQGKKYNSHKDDLPDGEYWQWMKDVCGAVLNKTTPGGSIYFMQREKTRIV